MVNELTFCGSMQKVDSRLSTLIALLSGKAGDTVSDNLVLQYPESVSERELGAGNTFVRDVQINRRLISLTVSAPEGITVVLSNNNETFLWFTDEAGNEKFPHGKLLGNLRLEVTNSGSEAARWVCRMVFD